MRLFIVFLVLILIAVPLVLYAQEDYSLVGEASYIVDGDTLDVGDVRVRLWGIDTPEKGEPGFKDAKDYLKTLVEGSEVECLVMYKDRYKRSVASCVSHNQDIGRMMVLSGMAKDFKKYSDGFYAADENDASIMKRGFWKTFWAR